MRRQYVVALETTATWGNHPPIVLYLYTYRGWCLLFGSGARFGSRGLAKRALARCRQMSGKPWESARIVEAS